MVCGVRVEVWRAWACMCVMSVCVRIWLLGCAILISEDNDSLIPTQKRRTDSEIYEGLYLNSRQHTLGSRQLVRYGDA